eukprot:COSAG02_NODE_14389_length_1277_cov_1.379457_1_plen_297_part_00
MRCRMSDRVAAVAADGTHPPHPSPAVQRRTCTDPDSKRRLAMVSAHVQPARVSSTALETDPGEQAGRSVTVAPLSDAAFGCEISEGWTIARIAAVAERPATIAAMRAALQKHQLIVMGGGGSMAELRAVHICANQALDCKATIPPPDRQNFSRRPGTATGNGTTPANLAMRSFPGFSESGILGRCDQVDWEGLSGFVAPTSKWQTDIHQWHHDIKMGDGAPPLAPVVSLYCAETPREGNGAMKLPTGETLKYAAGATLFASTRIALDLAPPQLSPTSAADGVQLPQRNTVVISRYS